MRTFIASVSRANDVYHRAFSSFPDSNTSEHVGENIFTFRTKLPECAKRMYVDQLPPPVLGSKETPLGIPLHTDGYVYGYVFFRQRRDKTRKRGYFQVNP